MKMYKLPKKWDEREGTINLTPCSKCIGQIVPKEIYIEEKQIVKWR